ncbi:MAG: ABC transporter permease subunit [Chloroflexi bacterium]|jgi:multiple sugar transport system permease protein|nr:ABC transporter permease subunit [Chloroflexota bacterium]
MLTRRRRSVAKMVNYFVFIAYAVTILLPLYYVLISSFKGNVEIFNHPLGWPETVDFGNYLRVQERVNALRAIGTSFVITTASLFLILIVSIVAAYGIARVAGRFETKWPALIAEAYFGLGFLIPAFSLLVPVFLLAARTGLLYNPGYLILFYVASNLSLSILMLSSHMRGIPRELEEAAEIDGASRFQILRYVIVPLSRSGIMTVSVLNFIGIWNEYIFALMLLDSRYRTIQVAIPLLRTMRKVDYGLISAGVVAALIPVYVVFIFFQERVIQGMSAGAVKQ